MTTSTKLTEKQRLANKIVAFEKAGYTLADCESMKTSELKELLAELQTEAVTPDPEVAEGGAIVVHKPTVELPKPPVKGERAGGPSKRDVLYAAFDKAHEEKVDLKAAGKAALPETSDGVISSYMCYWRKDRGVAATRGFGEKSKATNGQKVKALLVKLYGEDFDMAVVTADVASA